MFCITSNYVETTNPAFCNIIQTDCAVGNVKDTTTVSAVTDSIFALAGNPRCTEIRFCLDKWESDEASV
jgi:hypothetical protein